MNEPERIVTHGGQAHHDELLAVALALGRFGPIPVERRDPTAEELDDPRVMVIDIGRRHEPRLLDFDHHQWKPDREKEARSALALVAEHLGLSEALSQRPWYRFLNRLDVLGPTVVARELGLEKIPRELQSPIDVALLDEFSSSGRPGQWLIEFLARLGKKIADDAKEAAALRKALEKDARVVEAAGLRGVVVERKIAEGLESRCWLELLDDLDEKEGPLAFSLSPDQRGEGLALYRLNDHPGVDLSRLAGEEEIVFAHPGGFVAKTGPGVTVEGALKLFEKAVTR